MYVYRYDVPIRIIHSIHIYTKFLEKKSGINGATA